jgi:PiT family inorganic phosphate transporter
VPLWIVLAAHAAIALGTLSGGWRIVKTLGHRITALKPPQGFAAETAGAASLYLATYLGVPVSTTHTITGAVVGAGATRRLSAVRWGVARRVVFAWVVTIPAAGLIAAVGYELTTREDPVVAWAALVLLAAAAMVTVVRRGGRPGAGVAAPTEESPVSRP